ncbi:MAG: TerD family protein [Actinomycetota bacterium]|nr:TerD family protein [Actinomycetota bacterium]
MQQLSRGANCPLPSPVVTLSVACASSVDVSALLVAEDGKVRSDADLVFYNAPSAPGVRYLGGAQGPRGVDAVVVDTAAVPPDVARVVVTASLDGSGPVTFGQAGSMVVTVLDGAGADAVTFPLTELTTEKALICAEVYRRGDQWKLRAVGQGYDDGLAGIATEFGVDVDDEPTAAAPDVAAAPAAPAAAPPAPAAPAGGGPVNLDKGRVSLKKGEKVSLVKTGAPALTRVAMGLGWDPAPGRRSIDLDASVIAFNSDGKDIDTVWFMSKEGCGGAVRHSGDNLTGQGEGDDEVITVDLARMPPAVRALVFTVNSFSGQRFSDVASSYCRLLDERGSELVRFDLVESPRATGVLMCKLVLQLGGTWEMTALGQFHNGKSVKAMVKPARAAL